MNKMDWNVLREEIKNKTEEEMASEMDSLYAQFPIGGEFVKQRMERGNLKENYRLLRDFFNCDQAGFEGIIPDMVLLHNGKEVKVGDSIYCYGSGWTVFIGIETRLDEYKPYCIYLSMGVGFNSNSIRVDAANDSGTVYEFKKREEIPTDLHYSDMRGYKKKCTDLYKAIKKYYQYDESKWKMIQRYLNQFSYEELSNFHYWDFDINNGQSDSWYGNSCITDRYTRVTLDTSCFKYSDKFVTDTYGYRY